MLYWIFHLQKILENNTVNNVLDIWAGKWYMSLFAASYGADVDAVEPNSMKKWHFPTFLSNHPKIQHHHMSIEEFTINKQYDLIIMTNIIMFLDRQYFFETLFPNVIKSMSIDLTIIITYFDATDQTIKHGTTYRLEDFTQFSNLKLIEHSEKTYTENHPPQGKHTHHAHVVILKKLAEL